MANRTNLGIMLGQLVSGTTDQNGRQRGYLDGMRGLEAGSQIELNRAKLGDVTADSDIKRQRLQYMNPEAVKRQALRSMGFDEGMEIPQDKMPDIYKVQASIENGFGNENKSFDLAKQLSQIQRNNITANVTPQNALDVATQVGAMDGKMVDILKNQLTQGIANDGKANANERGLLYSQGKGEFNNLGSDGTFNQITGASQINPQAIKTKEATKPQWDSTRGVFVSPDGTVTEPRLPDGGKLPEPMKKKTELSATAQKELFEAEDVFNSSTNTIDMLNQALDLNTKAFSGIGAKPLATITSNIPFVQSDAADATINLDNLMTGQALESLKAVFGGMPTEGERKILLDIQASADKTPKQREEIITRAVEMANRRKAVAEQKMNSLRSGEYFSQAPTPAKPTAKTSKQVKRTGHTKDGRKVVEYTDGTREYQ